ncbi:hypothetical protein [Streptomyces sindenensis]|uniref:Secreted protein n=1 Tax=Streptomyces sindenensis TaxID=67363 RepID=A0ABW6E944_9ACTN
MRKSVLGTAGTALGTACVTVLALGLATAPATAAPPAEDVTRTAYQGDLVIRVTNKETGAHYDADVSGTALVDVYASGAQFWRVLGPVLVGVGEGNLARGLYVVDGAYTIAISPTGTKTVAGPAARTDSICARID